MEEATRLLFKEAVKLIESNKVADSLVNREVYPVGETFDLKLNSFFYLDPQPKEVIFHDPATIVYWTDGTKTVVKSGPHDTFDPEKGLAMAIAKKHFGNGNEFHKVFKKWVPDES